MNRMTVAAIVVASALCAALWVAWLESPERAALLADREAAQLRQSLASERAELRLLQAECAEAARENGPAHGAAVCEHYRLQLELSRERQERIRARMDELQRQRGDGV